MSDNYQKQAEHVAIADHKFWTETYPALQKRIADMGGKVVNIHDEIIIEIPEGLTEDQVQNIMSEAGKVRMFGDEHEVPLFREIISVDTETQSNLPFEKRRATQRTKK